MTTPPLLAGVFAPVVTPFTRDLGVDRPRFSAFCRWLVKEGAGLAIFGTNSEANSLTLAERLGALDRLLGDGIDPAKMMPGTGCCSIDETVTLTAKAVQAGCAGALMLPPFFYKGVSDDGLYAYYSHVIERVGSSALRVYLYHIPQVSGVAISHDLIERLIQDYPTTVVGIKDSSGDWNNTKAMLQRFPGFAVFPASEALLSKALPLGAAGCISATANIQPRAIAQLIAQFGTTEGPPLQQQVTTVRTLMQRYPMIAALKHVIAVNASEESWRTVRPPLTKLPAAQGEELLKQLDEVGFSMTGLQAQEA
jgi:4-hydroxy-tetrahydrodipicolinate synthase